MAHANKGAATRGGEPRLSDVAYSGAFAAMAQTAIVVSYPDKDDRHTIRVGCARAPETGFASFEIVFDDGPSDSLHVGMAGVSTASRAASRREQDAEQLHLATVARRADEIEKALQRHGGHMATGKLRTAANLNGASFPDARDMCLARGSIASSPGSRGGESWYWVASEQR